MPLDESVLGMDKPGSFFLFLVILSHRCHPFSIAHFIRMIYNAWRKVIALKIQIRRGDKIEANPYGEIITYVLAFIHLLVMLRFKRVNYKRICR